MNAPPGAAKLLSKFRGAAGTVAKGVGIVAALTTVGAALGAKHGYSSAQYGLKSQGAAEGAREGAAIGATAGLVGVLAGKKLLQAGKVIFRRVRGRIIPIRG